MPPASPKSVMSPSELAICQDFLNGQWGYALDLLSNLKYVAQSHANDQGSCPASRGGQRCALCALCGANGLMGATKLTLEAYRDTDAHLKTVRALLGKSAHGRAVSSREGLISTGSAKVLLTSIVKVGDLLRLEHAKWRIRLQGELANVASESPSSSSSRPSELDKRITDLLLPMYSGAQFVGSETNPKSSPISPGSVKESSEASMFFVFRRCLSADCPCELNKGNTATGGSQITAKHYASLADVKNKGTAESRKTKAPAKAKTTTQPESSSVHRDSNDPVSRASDTARSQDGSLHGRASSTSTSGAAQLTQETESFSPSQEPGALIVDPRVLRLHEEIGRFHDARRALMAWCRAWTNDPENSLTCASTVKDPRGSPFALGHDMDVTEPGKLPCTMDRIGTSTKHLSHGDATMAQGLRFDKQEELRGRWLTARQKRPKDRKRRSSGRNLR